MKKKKALSMLLATAMVLTGVPAQSAMAEEMFLDEAETEMEQTDTAELIDNLEEPTQTEQFVQEDSAEDAVIGDEVEELQDGTAEVEAESDLNDDGFSDGGDVQQAGFEEKVNDISLNKNIKMKNLEYIDRGNGGCECDLRIKIPENGRINIVAENVAQLDEIIPGSYRSFWVSENGKGGSFCRKGIVINSENYQSGYITVKQGEYRIDMELLRPKLINNEAVFRIEYQSSDEYSGETEDNDSYDTANNIQSDIEYEGDYSWEQDVDYYKFIMENPGKVDISVLYKEKNPNSEYNPDPNYEVYSEDEDGNIEKIADEKGSSFRRLAAGNYYIKFIPGSDYYKSVYSLKVSKTYESEDEYEIEDNNLRATANLKKVNQWYNGNINNSLGRKKDIDWFKFDITQKSYIYAEMKTERGAEENLLQMEFFEGNESLETLVNTQNPYLKTKTYLVEPGTYYIRMENYPTYNEPENIPWDYSIRLVQRDYIDLTGLNLPASMRLKPGQSQNLALEYLPENTDDKDVEWISDSEDIATVDQNGKVTAKKTGTANIIVCGKTNQEIQASCEVTVYQDKPVSINKKSASLLQGKTLQLKLNNADKGIIWKSSNSGVAKVTQTGKLTAGTSGKATISARYKGKTYSCVVTVLPVKQVITYIKSLKTKTVTLKWKKNTKAAGYQIQYSTDSKMKKSVKTLYITNRNTYTRTVTGLQKNKKYYFRVRAYGMYKTQKIYGSFSQVKNCKAK